MFTGIVQGVARVSAVVERLGLRTFTLQFPARFGRGLEVGASVAVDGTCLTVTALHASPDAADETAASDFDVMAQTLALTTLAGLRDGARVNVERAAKEGAEVGGHVLSGHVDTRGTLVEVRRPENNHVLRIALPAPWMRYVFPKGYVAVDGASLTVAEARREPDGSGWFEVWLIPETLRMTTFGAKTVGDVFNIEIERQTQIVVDTVERVLAERLGPLMPAIERVLAAQGGAVDAADGAVAALAADAPPPAAR
jgi:riboflavin synthase